MRQRFSKSTRGRRSAGPAHDQTHVGLDHNKEKWKSHIRVVVQFFVLLFVLAFYCFSALRETSEARTAMADNTKITAIKLEPTLQKKKVGVGFKICKNRLGHQLMRQPHCRSLDFPAPLFFSPASALILSFFQGKQLLALVIFRNTARKATELPPRKNPATFWCRVAVLGVRLPFSSLGRSREKRCTTGPPPVSIFFLPISFIFLPDGAAAPSLFTPGLLHFFNNNDNNNNKL